MYEVEIKKEDIHLYSGIGHGNSIILNGEVTETFQSFYNNDILLHSCKKKESAFHGPSRAWYMNGVLSSFYHHNWNQNCGVCFKWHETGELKAVERYNKKGERIGNWSNWFNGKPFMKTFYENKL